jgi:hypothetical protein
VIITQSQRAGRAGNGAAARHLPETIGDGAIKRHLHVHVESATDEGDPQRLAGLLRDLHTQAAENALTPLVNHVAMGDVALKLPSWAAIAVRPSPVCLRVLPKLAPFLFAAVAMKTAEGLRPGFFCGQPCGGTSGRDHSISTAGALSHTG